MYRPGTRAKDWIKIKNRMVVELVVGGYTEGTGHRAGTFGALLLGRPDGNALAFAGGVGTGFTHDALDSIAAQLRAIETSRLRSPPCRRPTSSTRALDRTNVDCRRRDREFTNDGLSSARQLHQPFRHGRLSTMPIDRHDAERLDTRDPLAQWRHEFVIPDPALIYLDGNSLGMTPKRTVAALQHCGRTSSGPAT